ncbi:MAG: NAD(P)/FAD-dependent oxidoreductase [Deltaproteobacteria bacterium]|nr:NAD(P)/FAD-dependent oxidoreductase [Deltaproteobacteria bacterium]
MIDAHSPVRDTRRRVRAPLPPACDVAVIGAGLGGLYAAATLARAGKRVVVLDGHYVAGGCATMFERPVAGGHLRFDVGVHYVGDCGPGGLVPRLLEGVGADVRWRPLDPDAFDVLVFPDFRFPIPANKELYQSRLIEMFPAEKAGIERYMRLLAEVDRLGSARPGVGLLMEALLHGRLAAAWKGGTIGAFLDESIKDPRCKAVMLGQNGDYGLAPRRVSAMLHAGLANHYFKGAFYPEGGGQVMADQLAEIVEKNGGVVALRKPVSRILVDGGRAVGVAGDDFELRAPVVLSNADIKKTMLELLPRESLPSAWGLRAQKWEMGGAIFLACFGVKGPIEGLGAQNLWQFDSYDFDAAYAKVEEGVEAAMAGCYVTSASLKDPGSAGHAPEGYSTIEAMTLVPGEPEAWGLSREAAGALRYRQDSRYRAIKQRVEDELLRRLDHMLPGTADRVVFRESATPVSHSRFTGASGGTGYGLAATPAQFLDKRPGARGPLPGLYLAGASTRSGHGIVGAMMSGKKAANAILSDT